MRRADRVRLIGEIVPRLLTRPLFDVEVVLREYDLLREQEPYHDNGQHIARCMSYATDDDLAEIAELVRGATPERVVTDEVQSRIWGEYDFRLFMSHIAAQKDYVNRVAWTLNRYGIGTFVAHVDIAPSREWLIEISAALATCEALAAFLHDGFKTSNWTDQEVGYVLGRGLLVIPIKFDRDPHGFMSPFQATNADDDEATMAEKILDVLVTNELTQEAMAPALVGAFERSGSFDTARKMIGYLERLPILPVELLDRIADAGHSNGQVAASWGVPGRIDGLLRRHGHAKPDDDWP